MVALRLKHIRQISLALLLASTIILTGCGEAFEKFSREQTPGYTDVVIGRGATGAPFAKDILNGGLMIYAMSPDGGYTKSAYMPTETGSTIMRLPNGSYKFYGLGWDTATLSTNPFCGRGNLGQTVALNGTAQTVQIYVDQTSCADSFFSDSNFIMSGAPTALHVVFCASNKNVNVLSTAMDCATNGDESSAFMFGNATGGITSLEGGGNENSSKFLFGANTYGAGSQMELFITSFNSGLNGNGILQRRISTSMFTTPGVTMAKLTAAEDKVVYIATQENTGRGLYVTSSTRIETSRINGGPTTANVKGFKLIENDTKVVYVSDEDTASRYEIFVVDIDGTDRIKISGATTGPGVAIDSGTQRPIWDITSDGTKVVYASQEPAAGDHSVFVALTSTASSSTLISPTKGHAGAVVIEQIQITPNNARAVFLGNLGTPVGRKEIYSAVLSPPATATVISQATQVSVTDRFEMDKDHDDPTIGSGKIAYSGDLVAAMVGRRDLAVVNADGTGHCLLTDISAVSAGASGDGVDRIVLNQGGTKIIYSRELSSAGTSDPRNRLFYNDISGACPAANSGVQLTDAGAFTGTGINPTFSGNGARDIAFADSDTRVIYIADQDGVGAGNGTQELWTVNIDGSGRTKISGTVTPGALGNVNGFNIGGTANTTVAFRGDMDVDADMEVYSVGVTGTPARVKISPPILTASAVQDFHIFRNADLVMMQLTLAGESSHTIVVRNLSDSTLRTIAKTHSATPLGRFRVHMLSHEAVGTSIVGFQTSISSGCLSGPASDGMHTNTSLKIPAGSVSGQIPFAVAIEIFPLASTCSGNSYFTFFPMGLARADLSAPAQIDTHTAGDSVITKVFIRDRLF